MLKDSCSFKAIGRELNKDCTSISKEVRNYQLLKGRFLWSGFQQLSSSSDLHPILHL
ncbi:helix-turn-helix domain-containing protein [Desulfitobacterium metallireducens]